MFEARADVEIKEEITFAACFCKPREVACGKDVVHTSCFVVSFFAVIVFVLVQEFHC